MKFFNNKIFWIVLAAVFFTAGYLAFMGTAEDGQVEQDDLETRSISLFYYNQSLDERLSCDPDAVVAVSREIPISQTPIQDTIKLLLRGELTESERQIGFTTEFPGNGFELMGANLENGVLTLEFDDPNNFSVGGSCRVGLLGTQVQKTAQQFKEVDEVRFIPEYLFQP